MNYTFLQLTEHLHAMVPTAKYLELLNLCYHSKAELYYCRYDTIFYMICPWEGRILYKRLRINVKLRYFCLHLSCCWEFVKGVHWCGARCGAVGWDTALQAGRSRVRIPMVSLEFFIDIILLAAPWLWGLIQPLTEMSTRNVSWR